MIEPIGHCRVCKGTSLRPLFSLGDHYVNDFPLPGKERAGLRVPLTLELCRNPSCGLVQLQHTAPSDFLYTRQYWYRSGVTETMRHALQGLAQETVDIMRPLQHGDVVLDIGSNDGTLLHYYPDCLTRIGVEPADNLATASNYHGLKLIHDFWPCNDRLIGLPKARIITAIGMFYDLDDPVPFVQGIASALAPKDGLFVAQLMCLQNMLAIGDIGNVNHEHLEYYTLKSLCNLFDQVGLEIIDIDPNVPVNGSSYRLYVQHKGARVPRRPGAYDRMVQALAKEERLSDPGTVEAFYWHARDCGNRVARFLTQKETEGACIWVYGASTKGNTLLQFYGLDHQVVIGAAERSPEKWGRVTVGTGIPIFSEEKFREVSPHYALVLPYTFIEEFKTRELSWLLEGGQFIVPLPQPRRVFWDFTSLRIREEPLP